MVELITPLIQAENTGSRPPEPGLPQVMTGMHCRSVMQNGRTSGTRKAAWRPSDRDALEKIERSIAYMRQNLCQSLQVARLAALVNVSSSHYFALFKRHTGSAPIDYFIRLRMDHARRLLDTTPLSVKGVAAALGYDDPFYFSRLFKSVNHIAPSDYRLMSPSAKESLRTKTASHSTERDLHHAG